MKDVGRYTLDQWKACLDRLSADLSTATQKDLDCLLEFESSDSAIVRAVRAKLNPPPPAPTPEPPSARTSACTPQADKDAFFASLEKGITHAKSAPLSGDDGRKLILDDADFNATLKTTWDESAPMSFVAHVCGLLELMHARNVCRNRKLLELEDRLAQLEARPAGLKYLGVWSADDRYDLNDGITFNGSLWVAKRATLNERLGETSAWQLACKKGKDGKDWKHLRIEVEKDAR